MGFLTTAFLGGLVALGVPVLLHLRQRDRDAPVRFPSLMFLERLPIRTAQRRVLVDRWLFALRALAVAALVAAFARPFLRPAGAAAGGERPRAVAVLLDRSRSMARPGAFAAAADSARAVLAALRPADQVAVVLFDEEAEVVQPLTTDHGAAAAAIATARVGSRGTRFAAALRAARQVLADAAGFAPEAVLVSDLQRTGVTGLAGLELPAGLAVRVVAVAPGDAAAATVTHVDVRRDATGEGGTVTVQARLATTGHAAPVTVRLALALEGRPSGTRTVTVEAPGERLVAFDPVAAPAGRVRGELAVARDGAAEPPFFFVVPGDDAVRVALVVPPDASGEETLFLERALAVGRAPAVRLARVPAGAVTAATLAAADLVLCWDVLPRLDAAAPWVRAGGGVGVVAGRRLAARAVRDPLLPAGVGALIDRAGGGSLGEVSLDHPLFAPFRDAPAALGVARFARYPRLDVAAGSDVLARFDDGAPAVIERRDGAGRWLVLAMPLDARAGDLPLQAAFPTLVRRLALYGGGHSAAPLWRLTGETALLRGVGSTPAVAAPDGTIGRPPADSTGVALSLTAAGFYAAYDGAVGGTPRALLAVNPPPGEGDLTPVDPRELLVGVREAVDSAAPAFAALTPRQAEQRQGWWRWLLLLVVGALIAEGILADRGWRRGALGGSIPPAEVASR